MLCHIVSVRLVRGPKNLVQKFKDLQVRSAIVKKLAGIYIDRHVADLKDRPGVLKIHTLQRCRTVAESLKKHAMQRIDEHYPEANAVLPGLAEVVKQQPASVLADQSSGFDMKQATMHDNPRSAETVFDHLRPTVVTDEGESADMFPQKL